MTITSTTSKNQYTATGSQDTFNYTFKIFDEDDITVITTDTSGVETVEVITTDYTVTGVGDDAGGTIVYVTDPTLNYIVTLKRNEPLTQEIDYVEGDDFPSAAHEEGLDRSAIRDQTIEEQLSRTALLKDSSTTTGLVMPEPSDGTVIGWSGVQLANLTAGSGTLIGESTIKQWDFDDDVNMADPGAGTFRVDNTTFGSATNIAISKDTVNGSDLLDVIKSWDDSDSAIRNTLSIGGKTTTTAFGEIQITGAITDNTTWLQIPVTVIDSSLSSGTFTTGDEFLWSAARTGDAGTAGSVSDGDKGDITVTSSGTTWTIDNDVVGLDQMAGGTDGNLITYDTSGDPAFVATGSATEVLTSNGAGAAPTFQAAASGGSLVLIESQTASNDATVEFTTGIDSTYGTYFITLENVSPATDTQTLEVQYSTNGGSSYAAPDRTVRTEMSGTTEVHSAASPQRITKASTVDSTASEGVSGYAYLTSFADAAADKNMSWRVSYFNSGSAVMQVIYTDTIEQTPTAIDAIEFSFASGNISTGTITLYGIAQS